MSLPFQSKKWNAALQAMVLNKVSISTAMPITSSGANLDEPMIYLVWLEQQWDVMTIELDNLYKFLRKEIKHIAEHTVSKSNKITAYESASEFAFMSKEVFKAAVRKEGKILDGCVQQIVDEWNVPGKTQVLAVVINGYTRPLNIQPEYVRRTVVSTINGINEPPLTVVAAASTGSDINSAITFSFKLPTPFTKKQAQLSMLSCVTLHCDSCGKSDVHEMLGDCSRCHQAVYCNRTCQKHHWKKGHKSLCV